jgi:hypothetical protein
VCPLNGRVLLVARRSIAVCGDRRPRLNIGAAGLNGRLVVKASMRGTRPRRFIFFEPPRVSSFMFIPAKQCVIAPNSIPAGTDAFSAAPQWDQTHPFCHCDSRKYNNSIKSWRALFFLCGPRESQERNRRVRSFRDEASQDLDSFADSN